jgi:hypothetical protein
MQLAEVFDKNPKAVFTVPTWWHHSQRQMLWDACLICGLKDFEFLDATVAQCIDLRNRIGSARSLRALLVDIGELNTNIASVTISVDKYMITAYRHLQIGGRNISNIVSKYVEDKLNKLDVADEDAYEKFIQDASPGGPTYHFLRDEIIKFKEKMGATITVPLATKLLTSDFDINITISGKEFYNLDQSIIFFDGLKRLLNDGDFLESSYDLVEIQGGCGCSDVVKNWFAKELGLRLTQRIHPLESIAEGGIFYLFDKGVYIEPPKDAWKIIIKSKIDGNIIQQLPMTFQPKGVLIKEPCKIYNLEADRTLKGKIDLGTFIGEDLVPGAGRLSNLIPLYENFPRETKFCIITQTELTKEKSFWYSYFIDKNGFVRFELYEDKERRSRISDLDAGIVYFLSLSEEDIKRMIEHKQLLIKAEKEGDALNILMNDFQSFYYSLNINQYKYQCN